MRRRQLVLSTLAAACAAPLGSWAQTRPLRLISPFAAGGPVDAISRRLAEALSPVLHRPVVVENKSGASGMIGTSELVRSAPNGDTLGIAIPDNLINAAFTVKQISYDARNDITPVALFAAASPVIAIRPEQGVKSVKDLIAKAKAKPGSVSFGSWGAGTFPHLIMGSIEAAAGVSFVHVPYRGGGPAVQDFLANQVDIAFIPVHILQSFVNKGWATPVAVAGPSRIAEAPSLPTLVEEGLGSALTNSPIWMGVIGPPKLPDTTVAELGLAIKHVTEDPKFVAAIAGLSHAPYFRAGPEFKKAISVEYEVVGRLMKQLKVVAE